MGPPVIWSLGLAKKTFVLYHVSFCAVAKNGMHSDGGRLWRRREAAKVAWAVDVAWATKVA